jgi:hypothetical protein
MKTVMKYAIWAFVIGVGIYIAYGVLVATGPRL